MRAYSEHLDKIQYIRNSLENEILWVRKVLFQDVLSEKSLKTVVEEYKIPLLYIWLGELGEEPKDSLIFKKSDKAIWDLNVLDGKSKELEEQNLIYVMLRTKCPKEIILEIMKAMDVIYMFCGKREYDSTDTEYIRQYCNIYMADHVYNSTELLNKLMMPINEVVEIMKKQK